jgi:hydroxypyruvate isomerase
LKQCFTWWSFTNRGISDIDLLRECKTIGYDGVELLDERLLSAAVDCGLEIVTHYGHNLLECGLNDPANHDSIERELEASLSLAAKYSIQNLIVFAGCRNKNVGENAALSHTVAGLKRIAPLAESAGVNLLIEILNSRVDHPYYQCDSTGWAADAVEQSNSENVKILYDIYHAQVMEGDLIRTIHCCAHLIGHYHTAGCPGRGEPDQTQEIYYPAVIAAIAETGYEGYIGHEFIHGL